MRLLRPDRYVGDPWLSGTLHDLDRALLHLDFGDPCAYPDCPSIRNLWLHGLVVDVTLLGGALLLGALAGSAAGRWCAGRRGTAVARGLEAAAMLFYCAPPYIVAYVALLLFDPFFGVLPVRLLVDPNRFGEPFATVPDFVRGMALPWLIAAAPVAAACLRLTLAMTAEAADEDYLRTALAKGVDPGTALRRHAGPAARASVA